MAGTAEQLIEQPAPRHLSIVEQPPEVPMIMMAAEMRQDEFIKTKAARFIGNVLSQDIVEVEAVEVAARPQNLKEAIEAAAQGDEDARRTVQLCVKTDVLERTYKTGHVSEVPITEDENGKLIQFGHQMDDVYANTLRYSDPDDYMHLRSKAEALNAQRIESYNREGLLEDYAFVVFSSVANLDELSRKEARKRGFFVDTMSMAIQLTTKEEDELVVESAFVGGALDESSERFDIQAIAEVIASLGGEYAEMSPLERLAHPILVHKSLLPKKILSLVERYDQQQGTFFGQAQPIQDYETYREVCQQREDSMADIVERITIALIAEHASLTDPVQAIARLDQLSETETLDRALTDITIDPRVYGAVAAVHIEQARVLVAQGNPFQAQVRLEKAHATADSSSCPGLTKKVSALDSPLSGLDQAELVSTDAMDEDCPEIKDGDIVPCPSCKRKVRAIVPSREEIYCSNEDCKLALPDKKNARK